MWVPNASPATISHLREAFFAGSNAIFDILGAQSDNQTFDAAFDDMRLEHREFMEEYQAKHKLPPVPSTSH